MSAAAERIIELERKLEQSEADNVQLANDRDELLDALEYLMDHISHLQPIHAFGGDGSVKGIRRAGDFMKACEQARVAIARAKGEA